MKPLNALIVLFLLLSAPTLAADGFVAPGDNMTLQGIPPVPKSIAEKADHYGNYRSAGIAKWHPERLEMLIQTRFGNTTQVHRVRQPAGMREQLTFFPEPVLGLNSIVADDSGRESFTFTMDTGGDEFFQIYRFDTADGSSTLLTDGVKRHQGGVRSQTHGKLAYQRVDAGSDGAFTEVRVIDPQDPSSDRSVKILAGGGWSATDWSPDGTHLLLSEYISINQSRLWLLDTDSGAIKRLLPASDESRIAYRGAVFAKDGRGFYTATDASSEFLKLTYVDFDTLEATTLTGAIEWDVAGFEMSRDGSTIALVANQAGRSALHLLDTATRSLTPVQSPTGVIGGLEWHNDSRHLGFTLTSATTPGDVFVLDRTTRGLERWTFSETGIDTADFPEAELIEWKSFDGRTISGFLYTPPARFKGKRPVIMNIHGGPESQATPRFLGRWNYFLNELGVAIVFPNVRGSAGFGKTYLQLDNGMLREGTYKDIDALLDTIAERPDLDEDRVMVYGGSYGGHMTLAVATRYSDRIRCSVNLFGLSNLRTFLENTQGYRRDLRRVEYGDERIPEMREWMDRTAPMTLVRNARKPMMVQQGSNDPRVPQSESDQIVASLQEVGTPTWYLLFDDEGHGFRKKVNADFAFYTVIQFAETYLLN